MSYRFCKNQESKGFILLNTGLDYLGKEWVVESVGVHADELPEPLADAESCAEVICQLLSLHYPVRSFKIEEWLQSKKFRKEVTLPEISDSYAWIRTEKESGTIENVSITILPDKFTIFQDGEVVWQDSAPPKHLYQMEALFELLHIAPF